MGANNRELAAMKALAKTKQWAVFPLNGKKPFPGSHGFKDATTDPAEVVRLWKEHPGANIGIATGEISNLFILDKDEHPERGESGSETLRELEKKLGKLPETVTVLTGGGGEQMYFRYPKGSGITIGEGEKSGLGVGLDFRGEGGYAVAPGSIHPETGRMYEWESSADPHDMELAELPEAWVRYIQSRKGSGTQKSQVELPEASPAFTLPDTIPEGERNGTLFRYAASLRARNVPAKKMLDELKAANYKHCPVPLSDREIEAIYNSVMRYPGGTAAEDMTMETSGEELPEGENLLENLTVFDAKSLMQKEFPEIYYPVEGLIPVGHTVMAAPPKTGKSWMCLQMGASIARGENFLCFHTKRSKVLYFALEDSEQFMQDRLKKVFTSPDQVPEDLHIVLGHGVRKLNKGFLKQLDAYLEMLPGVRVVIVDTLRFIRHSPARNVSPYDHDYAIGNALKKYADARGIALVTITHTTKAKFSDDDLLNISGTNGLTGAADALIVISKEQRSQRQAMLFVDGRRVQQSRHQIIFDKEQFLWEYQCALSDDDSGDEERKLQREYMESSVRKAVLAIASNNESWRGSAGEVVREAAKMGIGVEISNKAVGGFLSKNLGLFMKYDRIQVLKISNGSTSANLYRITEWKEEETNG